jgi:hypothetical protein
MELTLEALRADLINRWKESFARVLEVNAPPDGVVETVYTQVPAYALGSYSPKRFKPGARVSRGPEPGRCTYELDAEGRPLRNQYCHVVNGFEWRGIYRYAAEQVEHVEFCLQTRVPNLYNRLVLSGSAVLAEQRLIVNGGGSSPHLVGLTAAAQASRILEDPRAVRGDAGADQGVEEAPLDLRTCAFVLETGRCAHHRPRHRDLDRVAFWATG